MSRRTTLWGGQVALDPALYAFTTDHDRPWDARLLRWDVLGSLGHIEGLRQAGLLDDAAHRTLRRGLREALAAAAAGKLTVGADDEDVHTAVEAWLTARSRGAGERLHTGRSRNDQVATDLRLWLKHELLATHREGEALAAALLTFARRHRRVVWPGYTHQRRAMPSGPGLWAAALADGVLDALGAVAGVWPQLDRSPLGSAAGYGVPLPIDRRVAAQALGFAAIEPNVAMVQAGRGKLEAAALFWCTQLGHEVQRLAADVILFSAEEFGFLDLPTELATGSSIMPHKRNPDLFELARGQAAAVEGDLAATFAIKSHLTTGYHRDYQLLKEPVMRGVERTRATLAALARAVPSLGVNRERALAALDRGALATDEVMRRVEAGRPFRAAYREVKADLAAGKALPAPDRAGILARRTSPGSLGDPDLAGVARRLRARRVWRRQQETRFTKALDKLAGGAA